MVDHKAIAEKWQKKWEENEVFKVDDDSDKEKFYVLEMYPYPSGSGLHMGHALNYTIGDIFARYKKMKGFNVLHPMGFDSFGLPAENAAIKAKAHPRKFTEEAIANYIKQMKGLGISYDWSRMVETHKPNYYKWDQWIFLQMYKKGLVYKKTSGVNWCDKCNTVLANEQVHDGKCWRHDDTDVEVKELSQWYLKITEYADELFEGIKKLEGWPELIKKLQTNWINKSYGSEVEFTINDEKWPVFTTRVDTLLGVTFVVVAANHPKLDKLVTKDQKEAVEEFKKKIHSVKEEDMNQMEKEGVFTGSYAVHPLTGAQVPVYAGNFVLADYGSGMVMAVPAHDERDFEFAKKYHIPIKQVIKPKKQNCIVIPGVNSSKESYERKAEKYGPKNERNWFAWIKEEAEKVGIETFNPLMPAPWAPKYEEWKKVFEKLPVNENSILIGHSAGCSFILRWLLETKKKVDKLIFIAPADTSSWDNPVVAEFYNYKINASLKNQFNNLSIMWSDQDDERHQKTAEKFNKLLGGKIVNMPEKGHFTSKWMKEDEFPELLKEVVEMKSAFTEPGVLVNSGEFDNLTTEDAKKKITEKLESTNKGKLTVNFRLRDWLISRQRYWGTPIPVYYDENNEPKPVPDELLPVELPDDVIFEEGKGNPLETSKTHKITINGKEYKLETDTMDTFVNSSWYQLRYCDPRNHDKIFEPEKANYWCPVDQYIGGKEHACMHLIYIRFYTKFLRDLGLLNFDEPAKKLFNQGMLQGPDGEKMSKSKGNVVLPEVVSEKYGLDAARFFLVSQASPDKDTNWSDKGAEGSSRIVNKIFNYVETVKMGETSPRLKSKLHATIKTVEENIESLKYNLATIKIRELVDSLEEEISKEDLESFIKILSPICPHCTEQSWEKIGNKEFISNESWPKYDESFIDEKLDYLDELSDNLRKDIQDVLKLINVEKPEEIKLIISPKWKYDFVKMFKETIVETRNPKEIIGKIMGSELKKYGKDVMKMIPAFLKDESKLPKLIISQEDEHKNASEIKTSLEKEFNCNVILELADVLINKVDGTPKDKLLSDSKEQKARNASPSKPAILVK